LLDLALIELALVIALLLLAGTARPSWAKTFRIVEKRFDDVARHRAESILLVVSLCLGARLALLPLVKIPVPGVHDEFSYLLAADTFASGRLTNPTHPMWVHFETFHVNQRPTYQSMYQPAQGLVLAAGKLLLGHPWFGVWLSTGIMCGAITWAIYGWLPSRWALLGGLIATMRLGVFSYWMNSYWGGSVPATGGALVVGALPRLMRFRRSRDALLMAVGIAILAYSRPWEGLVLTAASLAVLADSLWSNKKRDFGKVLRRILLPMTGVLMVAGAALMYYCWRVTGDPFRLPFQVNRSTYAFAQAFYWQKLPPIPILRHKVMSDFYLGKELDWYRHTLTLWGFFSNQVQKLQRVWLFYIGPVLLIPIAMCPGVFRDRRLRAVVFIAAIFALGLMLETWPISAHYAAPLTAVMYVLLMQGARHWRATNRRSAGPLMAWGIVCICVAMFAIRTVAAVPPISDHLKEQNAWWCFIPGGIAERDHVLHELSARPGRHLILVRYEDQHNVEGEWVYNSANIDAQKVVWARDMGEVENQELLHYYSDREVWVVDPDVPNPQLISYAGPPSPKRERTSMAK
jgi:hypothetical protein